MVAPIFVEVLLDHESRVTRFEGWVMSEFNANSPPKAEAKFQPGIELSAEELRLLEGVSTEDRLTHLAWIRFERNAKFNGIMDKAAVKRGFFAAFSVAKMLKEFL